jgi:hypothetical protein
VGRTSRRPRETLALVDGALHFEHHGPHGPAVEKLDDEIGLIFRRVG